jgi:LPXTG-motif cell wall-anchored protein
MKRYAAAAMGLIAAIAAAALVGGPAYAATASVSVSAAEIGEQETVTISYDTGGTAGAKNWVGIFRHGVKPGTGSPSLDWRYAGAVSGSWTWGPAARAGWTNEASSITPGEVDVYLFANDGYSVLAGPTVLNIRAASTPRTDPKPAVDGVSELNVLTFNLWIGGSKVANGAHQVAEVMRQTDVDVAFLPERGDAPAAIAAELGYDQFTPAATNTGVVSRYPILSTSTVGRWTKAILDVNGTEVAVYGGHLEYRWYSEYLPRGYGAGAVGDWPAAYKSWDELDAPVTDVEVILEMNAQSGRPQSAAELVQDVATEKAAGRLAVIGGDFNEPSAQDWVEATKHLFDHRGTVVPWQTTTTLIAGGLVDAYRASHPDPVANPGFTWPASNPGIAVDTLTWAPKADERDRIDYIFYAPSDRLALTSSTIVGPKGTIVRGERVDDDSDDEILTPAVVWPSDHKAVLSTFRVCAESCEPTTPTDPEPGEPKLTVSGSLRAGGAISIDGSGFPAGAEVAFELHSDPVALGSATADGLGALHLDATIPASVDPGSHSLVALVGGAQLVSAAVQIAAAPGSGGGPGPSGAIGDGVLASTGADVSGGALLAAAAVLLGLALVTLRRRRTTS